MRERLYLAEQSKKPPFLSLKTGRRYPFSRVFGAGAGTKSGPTRGDNNYYATRQRQPLFAPGRLPLPRYPPPMAVNHAETGEIVQTYFRQLVVGKIGESGQTQGQ